MKITVVSCVFPPEPVVSSRTSFDVARAMAERGHDVTVLAPFPNRPAGKLYSGYRRAFFRSEEAAEGLRIIRCNSFFSRSSSILSRLAENVSFGVTSALALLFRRKPAVIYANTWPIFASAMISVVARLRRIPLVVSVQDVYPESLISQGRRGSGTVARVLLAIDRFNVRTAAAVVVISERFAERYQRTRGVDASRIHIVPNWLSAQGTQEVSGAPEACRDRNCIPRDAFLLVYGGNVSVSAGLVTVIDAFRYLDDEPGVYLLVAGEGASLDVCIRMAREIAPERIRFEHPWLGTMDVLHAGDVALLPTHAAQSTASVPSKLISYLFSARPVLAAALPDSDTAAVVRGSGAGLVVDPDDPAVLADAIRSMRRLSHEDRQRMGSAGRAWALSSVTTEVCLPRLVRIVEGEAR